jgi:pimeloyl-ACP methyl ester carboxylesterase
MQYLTPEFLWLEGAHGLRLAADSYGDRNAPPVLLLHGGGQTRHSWGGTAQALAELGFRAIAVDARGHGESDRDPDGRYTMEPFAADLAAIGASFAAPPAVVGASLGGNSAMLAHGEIGTAFGGIVFVDIGPRVQRSGVERIYHFMQARPDGYANLEEVADAVAAYQPQRERPKDVSGLAKNLRQGEDGRWRWHWDPAFLEGMFQPQPELAPRLEAAAKNLSCPVLIVRGKLSDLLSEQDAQAFREMCPHAEYVDVAGAGHMVAGDVNDRFTSSVADFLTRRYAAPAQSSNSADALT